MRKIVAGFASSVDGYIEGPNGEYDWIVADKEMDFAEQMKRYDTFLLGRVTYEKIIAANYPPGKGITNIVFSRSLKEVQKGYILINNNIEERVLELKQQPGKDIALFGGASLLASLLDLKLVDELQIAVVPILLGKGKPMVDVLKQHVPLTLSGVKTYGNGTIQQTYFISK